MVDWCTTCDKPPVPGTTVEIKIRPFLVPGTVDVVHICSVAQCHSRGFSPIFSCFPQPLRAAAMLMTTRGFRNFCSCLRSFYTSLLLDVKLFRNLQVG